MPDQALSSSEIDGTFNFRDLGGLPLTSGEKVRSGVLFRSDALSSVTAAGLAALAASPIGVVVDFRTPEEQAAAPDRLPDSRPFQTVNLSILEGALADAAKSMLAGSPDPEALAHALSALPSLSEMYVGMLKHGASSFAEVAKLIAASRDAPSAVLVHCTAGKDRTGVATALILSAVGVEHDAIVADYALSQTNLAGTWATNMLTAVSSAGLPPTPDLSVLITGTPPAAIETALAWIKTNYSTAADYLVSGGLSSAELATLQRRLTY